MTFTFALCPGCIAQYRRLTHDPTCRYSLNSIPFCSLVWPEEHPEDGIIAFPDPNHEECRASIIRLVAARTRLWRTGTIPEESKELWAEARRLIPGWPGFLRLTLNQEQCLSLEDCAGELNDLVGAIAADFPQMTLTDKGGGLTEFSAHRGERALQRPPMLVMEFSKGSSQALALEFYPENVDAFTQQLPNAKAALLHWKAKHGGRCEKVLFTVVSVAEQHIGIESVIQQVCCDEAKLAPLLQSLDVRVALFINPEGEPVKEYALAGAVPARPAKAKPWWRFW